MRLIRVAALLVMAAAFALAVDPAQSLPVLRPSPEFKIRFVDGSQVSLSSFRGKVVALLFVSTPLARIASIRRKCSRSSTNEYGSRGFQPVDVAFNTMANLYVRRLCQELQHRLSGGLQHAGEVMGYLGFSIMERYVVPQIVWIDRKGNIRSQTPAMGDDDKTVPEALLAQHDRDAAEGAGPAARQDAPRIARPARRKRRKSREADSAPPAHGSQRL